jgi:polyisoprenoid-binding protein YceI
MTKLKFLITVTFLITFQLNAQKFYTRSGNTSIEGSEKSFEPVSAINETTTVILDLKSNNLVAQVFIAGFEFKNALMQEHFNENYMDTNKYPKAIFKGTISIFSLDEVKIEGNGLLTGILTVKGIDKKIEVSINIKEESNRIYLSGNFYVKPEDFDIKIPAIVKDKIAKEIQININYELVEKK